MAVPFQMDASSCQAILLETENLTLKSRKDFHATRFLTKPMASVKVQQVALTVVG